MASVIYGKCIMANVIMAKVFMAKVLWQMKLSPTQGSDQGCNQNTKVLGHLPLYGKFSLEQLGLDVEPVVNQYAKTYLE